MPEGFDGMWRMIVAACPTDPQLGWFIVRLRRMAASYKRMNAEGRHKLDVAFNELDMATLDWEEEYEAEPSATNSVQP